MTIFFKRLTLLISLSLAFIPMLSEGKMNVQGYHFEAPAYETHRQRDASQKISIDGYFSYAVPGYPDLPSKVCWIAVPPDVNEQTIEVEYVVKKEIPLGQFNIEKIPPLLTRRDDKAVMGATSEIYGQNRFYPENIVEYLGVSQMRKWRLIRIKFTPFQYNPVTGHLNSLPEVEVRVKYLRRGMETVPQAELADQVMDNRAKEMVINFPESLDWYKAPENSADTSSIYDYVIITTSTIKYTYSHYLSGDLVTHLKNKGYKPLIVTELDFGGLVGQYPNGTAEKIRKWLKDHYLSYGIEYVLLIGNPDPDDPEISDDTVGNIPMKICLGRGSDYFYADLTGNWDLDGDGVFAEYEDDSGSGGVDFVNEVYVGRIPFYSSADDLVSVLTKIVNYGNETNIFWRRNALLPMPFQDPTTDKAYFGEAMVSGYLTAAGFWNWKMYQQGAAYAEADSIFASDEELRDGKTKQRWSTNKYGAVWWAGHGSPTATWIGWGDHWDGTVMTSSDVTSLNDSYPSFVFQSSCQNGEPEVSDNLGKSLLYHGAIATLSTNRTSWYASGSWSTGLKYYCDDSSIGYYYGEELIKSNKTAGKALFDVKSDMGVNQNGYWKWDSWKNLFGYNLYGDPSVSILENGIGPAVDNNSLQWFTIGDGTSVWFIQSVIYYYDGDAAQSGDITHNESVSIYSKVTGPATLTFYWKVSSENNYDFLEFAINGYTRDKISGEKGWEKKTYTIPSGLNGVSWTYKKDGSVSSGSDCGWLDKVVVQESSCPDCSGHTVTVENVTFVSGDICECVGTNSITIGTGVTVQTGATVTFKAPVVHVNPGFHAENGSTVSIRQE